jgi:hypothetical protein
LFSGVAGSDYETISGNFDTPFRIQRNHNAIQQRLFDADAACPYQMIF